MPKNNGAILKRLRFNVEHVKLPDIQTVVEENFLLVNEDSFVHETVFPTVITAGCRSLLRFFNSAAYVILK